MIKLKNGCLVISLYFLFSFSLFAETIKFQHFNAEHGLSSSKVQDITQDKSGFIWIGTNNGLNRYDGYTFELYKKVAGDSTSLVNNHINTLFVDSEDRLWIGTIWGVSLYDRKQNNFKNFLVDQAGGNPISIKDIVEDNQNNIWIILDAGNIYKYVEDIQKLEEIFQISGVVTASSIDDQDQLWIASGEKLFYYSVNDNTLYPFIFPDNMQEEIVKTTIWSLNNQNNILWIGTGTMGILSYHKKNKEFHPYISDESNIYFIEVDHNGDFWIGTSQGIQKYSPKSGKFIKYLHDINNEVSLSATGASCFHEDIQGNKWIGTSYGGVNLLTAKKAFNVFDHQSEIPLSRNNTTAVLVDDDDQLWIGSFNAGIDLIDRKKKTKKYFYTDPNNPYSLGDGTIHDLYQDKKKQIWIGTYRKGIQRYHKESGQFESYQYQAGRANNTYENDVRAITEDQDGNIWFVSHGAGVFQFNLKDNQFSQYTPNPDNPQNSLGHEFAYDIFCDSKGQIWIATIAGLSKKTSDGFITYRHNSDNNKSLSNNVIYSLHEDSRGRLWVGTGEGLNLFDPADQTFVRYTKSNGFRSDHIFSILEDDNGILWLGTNDGLIQFNPETQSVHNYDIRDGLMSNEFFPNSCFKTEYGEIIFGGVDGVVSFFPDSLKKNPYAPPVHIVDLKLSNQSVLIDQNEGSVLKQHISQTEEIILNYHQNVISLKYVALNFISPENNQYAYMLENFDKAWNYVGSKREAIYTNLDPGKYVFRVKAANNDGIWNEEGTSLKIIIKPPFWATTWFRILVGMMFITLVWCVYEWRIHSIRSQNRDLEQKVEEHTRDLKKANEELVEEMSERQRMEVQIQDELKQKKVLLRELYHRTKNNMQVISSMVRMQNRLVQDEQMKDILHEIENKIMSMALVHQKLYESNDLNKISLKEYFKGIISLMQRVHTYAQSRVIFKVDGDDVNISIDAAIPCGLIVNELITNAMKYAFPDKKEGEIKLHLSLNSENDLYIQVSDNGQGLPAGFDIKKDANLGLESVIALAEHQLQGEIKFENNNGLHCIIVLREEMYKVKT